MAAGQRQADAGPFVDRIPRPSRSYGRTSFSNPVCCACASPCGCSQAALCHGELIRDGHDETMTLDPNDLQLLYQGCDPASGGRYELLPYQLGFLTLDRSR